ncbi:MAG: lolB [Xanthomonadaceae bacterium]|nr:lolB [Xanthomonadaceae bacterium]
MSAGRVWMALASAILLTACVGRPVRQQPPAAVAMAEQVQLARVAMLAGHRQWSLQGRVALSNGRNGGSGRIDWQQDGARYLVSLSAPITRQSWRLQGAADGARLEGLEGVPRLGADAETLLRDATGWEIPVNALASWVRGAADAGLPQAVVQYGSDGHLSNLRQAGWSIDYSDWRTQPALGIDLPARLDATREGARVRLIVDHWQEGAPTP